MVEPLGGLLGERASIFCQSHATNVHPNALTLRNADDLTLIRMSGPSRIRPGPLNATHVEFILSEVQRSDNGTRFVCSFHEFNSFPATFTVTCKWRTMGQWTHSVCSNTEAIAFPHKHSQNYRGKYFR